MADNAASSAAESGSEQKGHGRLTLWIIVAIVLAVIVSIALPGFAVKLDIGGEIFLRLLQMVVVPLVMASVMSGILGLGDVRKLGKPGGCAILYYLTTTVLAVATGLIVVNIIRPGVNFPRKLIEDARTEGSAAVQEAKSGRDESAQHITWGSSAARNRTATGRSNAITIPADHSVGLEITIEQVGEANSPAEVQLWVSFDGETFDRLGEPLRAKTKPDTYRFGATEETKIEVIPEKAKRIELQYTAQSGGAASIVTAQLSKGPPTIHDIFKNLVLMLFTSNLLESMVEVNLLPVIVFSIVFAGMLTTMGKRSEAIANLVVSINDALMSFILLLMKIAPLGIFCLVAARFGKAQLEGQFVELIKVQAWYMLTVLSGLAIHAVLTLPLIYWIFTRKNPYRFIGYMSQAILTAFSTASSTATLPVTMECAEMRGGVSKRSTEFVLPLGATINMDGTALYEAAAAIFIAQAYVVINPAFQLDLLGQLTIAITATLAAIGAAGIPEAGLVTMLIVLNAVGLPLEMIGLILPVDWLLDRFRTSVNAFGDSVGAAIVDKTF
jgi:Na+/H+-dicarboxylate symporter